MAVPSFKENPAAYGLGVMRPNHMTNRYKRPAVAKLDKPILPELYDSTLIRPLVLIPGLECSPNSLKGISKPKYMEVAFERCFIDYNSQRELKQISLNLMQFAVENFDWTKFKMPNGIMAPDGRIFITDGQTTAHICLHHPDIDRLPIYVVSLNQSDFAQRCAAAFVSLNGCKVSVPRSDQFTAQITMGDPNTIALADIFKRHKIRPVGANKSEAKFGANETRLLESFQSIFRRRGPDFTDLLCAILGGCGLTPIKRMHVAAVSHIIKDFELRAKQVKAPSPLDTALLIEAIRSMVDRHAMNEAQLAARHGNTTATRALAAIYMKRYKAPESARALARARRA